MTYVQLGEVNTWYDEHGSGEPLVMLHPGGVDARAYDGNLPAFSQLYRVLRPERRGHGRTADVEGAISFAVMAQDTIAFLETVVKEPVRLFGYSDGAVVALLVALERPDLVRRLVFGAGVHHHEGWLPGVLDADDETLAFLGDWYGEVSPDGRDHFPVVMAKLDRMHRCEPTLTPADLATLAVPTLIMTADGDEMPLEHSLAMHRAVPGSRLAVLPGASHGFMVEQPEIVNRMVLDFLAG